MKCQIDLKSLLIGILLTVCVFVAMGASQSSFSSHPWRYQLVPVGHETVPYVIDVHTGRAWRKLSGWSEFREIKISREAFVENNR